MHSPTTDYIIVERGTSVFHQHQHAARQLAHLLLDHPPGVRTEDGLPQLLDDPRSIQQLRDLGRAAYHTPAALQAEADLLAYRLLVQRGGRRDIVSALLDELTTLTNHRPAAGNSHAAALERFAAVLEGRP